MLHRGSGLHCVTRFHVGHAPGVTRVGFAHRDLAGVGHGGTQELGLPVQRYLVTNKSQVNQGITIKHYRGESLIRRSMKITAWSGFNDHHRCRPFRSLNQDWLLNANQEF